MTWKRLEVHDPENTLKIDSVWAFISQDENGNEGLVAAPMGRHGFLMPLIAADEKRLESLKPIALELARHTKKKIQLIRLTTRELVEEFK